MQSLATGSGPGRSLMTTYIHCWALKTDNPNQLEHTIIVLLQTVHVVQLHTINHSNTYDESIQYYCREAYNVKHGSNTVYTAIGR